jgi:hypothetical protein
LSKNAVYAFRFAFAEECTYDALNSVCLVGAKRSIVSASV